jgi:integrase
MRRNNSARFRFDAVHMPAVCIAGCTAVVQKDHLLQHLGDKKAGRVFEARNGSPISGNNILQRVLHPPLKRLGIPKAGLHAFRHSRVTMLRKNGTPEDLQKQWIGHSSLRTNRQVFTHRSGT